MYVLLLLYSILHVIWNLIWIVYLNSSGTFFCDHLDWFC